MAQGKHPIKLHIDEVVLARVDERRNGVSRSDWFTDAAVLKLADEHRQGGHAHSWQLKWIDAATGKRVYRCTSCTAQEQR